MDETAQFHLMIFFIIGSVIAWGGLAITYYLDHRKKPSNKGK